MRLIVLTFCAGMLALCGCGIKPSTMEAPASVKVDTFPRTYPDPSTDPQPQRPVTP